MHVIDECRAGWLDESRDIFGVGNRQEHSRARRGCSELFRLGSPLRRDAARGGEGQKSNVPGRESVRGGTERERERERVGGVQRGTETICPHMLCPAYVGAASRKRENRSSETGNRLSAR